MNKENVFLGGAVAAAIGAKLCCIAPLAFVLFGLGAVGAASVFEPFRPFLLSFAVLSLAYGFYRVYFRREKCAVGESCASAKTASKTTQAFLWISIFAVSAIAFSPYLTNYFADASSQPQPAAVETMPAISSAENETNKTVVIAVEGMTCEGCAMQINETLRKMKGIVSAEASFANKNVKVVYDEKQITLDEIKRAINALGYKAK